jgi:hypothetical protein
LDTKPIVPPIGEMQDTPDFLARKCEPIGSVARRDNEGELRMKNILVFLLAAISLVAADATGTWTGTFTPDGQEAGSAHLVLKQEGTKLTGTAGPHAGEQLEIQNGKAEDGNLTFEVAAKDSTMKFVLKQEGDEIKGNVSREREGQVQTAKLAVTRGK